MMTGYHGQPDKTAEAEWFDREGKRYIRTGDVGRFDDEGFLVLLDRRKDMVISGGFNVYPSDLEAVLRAASRPSPRRPWSACRRAQWGETPVAFVVPARRRSARCRGAARLGQRAPRQAPAHRVAALRRRAAAQRHRQDPQARAARPLRRGRARCLNEKVRHGRPPAPRHLARRQRPQGDQLWLGTMMFGDQTDEAEAGRIVDASRDAGINAIDTADAYADGESERITGRLIAADRDRWVLATKLANPTGPGPNDLGLSRGHMIRALDGSLKRLGTDCVDILYLHKEDATTPLEETVAAMRHLLASGKVHYFGLSNFRAWRIARMVELCRDAGIPAPIVCQPPYNAMTRGIETEVLPCCAHYGVGVVAYSPLARGVLSGKYAPDAAPPEGSRAARGDKRILQTEFRAESLALAQKVVEHARRGAARRSPSRSAGSGTTRSCTASSAARSRSPNGRTTSPRWTRRSMPTTRRSWPRSSRRTRVDAGLQRSGVPDRRSSAAQCRERLTAARAAGGASAFGREAPCRRQRKVDRRRGARRSRRVVFNGYARCRVADATAAPAAASPFGLARMIPRLPSEASERRTMSASGLARSSTAPPASRRIATTASCTTRIDAHRDREDLAERRRVVPWPGDAEEGREQPEEIRHRDRHRDRDPLRGAPARDAAAARQPREGDAMEHDGVDRQQRDEQDLHQQLRVDQIVGALEQAMADDRRAGDPEDEQCDHHQARDELVRRRDPDPVLGELRRAGAGRWRRSRRAPCRRRAGG